MTKIKKTFQINNKGGAIKNFSVDWKWGKPEWGEIKVNSPTLNSFPKEVTVEIDPQSISDYDREVKGEIEVRIDEKRTTIPVSFVTREKPLIIEISDISIKILKGTAEVVGFLFLQLFQTIAVILVGIFMALLSSPTGWLILLLLLVFLCNGTHY